VLLIRIGLLALRDAIEIQYGFSSSHSGITSESYRHQHQSVQPTPSRILVDVVISLPYQLSGIDHYKCAYKLALYLGDITLHNVSDKRAANTSELRSKPAPYNLDNHIIELSQNLNIQLYLYYYFISEKANSCLIKIKSY
jgi:hypothetical protein